MNGSPTITRKTTKEMQDARLRGDDKTDWSRVRHDIAAGIEPADDPDSPDATQLMRQEVNRIKRGRALGSGTKSSTTLRFDNDILAAFKATGKGWQTRMNNALREWLREHKPA